MSAERSYHIQITNMLTTNGEAIGIMEGAFFVSKSDILSWLNSFLQVSLSPSFSDHS